MLQQDHREDFVLATEITTTIRQFIIMSFNVLGIRIELRGSNDSEIGVVASTSQAYNLEKGKVVIRVDLRYYRPTEVDLLIGDPSKAKSKLGWVPKYDLKELVTEMVNYDLNCLKSFIR